jgi:hypothetical protein
LYTIPRIPVADPIIEIRDVYRVFVPRGGRERRAFVALRHGALTIDATHIDFMYDTGQITDKPSAREGLLWTNRFIGQ